MTTTVCRDSIVGDAWIQQTAAAVPIQKVMDPETNTWNGDFLTGPVRLAFDNLFVLPKQTEENENPKYGATLLFTPYADFTLLQEEYYRLCAEEHAEKWNPDMQQYQGLYSPFRDQIEKTKFGGFTPGSVFMSCSSKFKIPVVDNRRNPIVDQSKVYPGVWAICGISAYPSHNKKNPGVSFGLQSVMIIGDDNKFGGGAPDPNKTFGGVNVTAPITRPDVANAAAAGAAGAPPAAGIPGYTQPTPAPAAAVPPAGAPLQAPAPAPVQQPGAPVMPGAPIADDMDFMN